MTKLFMTTKLNDSQKQAVKHDKGPLLIIAGAGTGKTTVITQRIEHLIKTKKAKADELAALTFTNKAAGEMVERLDHIMPYGYEEPWINTFHSFCDRILKEDGIEIGLSPDYQLLSQSQEWMLLRKNIYNLGLNYYLPLGNPAKFINALIKLFSRIQDEDVQQLEIDKFLKKKKKRDSIASLQNDKEAEKEEAEKYEEVFEAFKKYQQLKIKENVMSFGDLIAWTLKLFRTRKSILAKYQKQFKYILVDEFQDTNFAQLQLIKLLAPPKKNPNLTVVGDDDQAIYSFRGSSVHNILDFRKHYPSAKEIVLTINYRSGQPILNASYQSIKNNNPDRLEEILKIDKKLVSARGKNLPKPEIIELETLEDEVEFVIEKILNLVGKDYTYKDIAILARANNHLEPFMAGLRRTGIAYQLLSNKGLFDQQEVKDLLAFLKIAANPDDNLSLFYFLHIENFQISSGELVEILNEAKTHSISLWQVINEKSQTDKRYQKIIDFVANAQAQDTKKSIVEILFKFINDSNFIKPFLETDSIENQLKIKNINLFFEKLKEYDRENLNSSIVQVVEYFDMLLEAGENPAQAEIEDIDTVSLLTVHSAKGLEWPIVFLVNAVVGRFPSSNRRDQILLPDEFVKQNLPTGNEHRQEERRLFYVAVTRTRDYFYATCSKDYGGARAKKPSGFLKELQVETKAWQSKQKQLSFLVQTKGIVAPKPQRILDGKINLTRLSYTQVDVYQTCPLKYKYQYVLKVPVPVHQALSYGNTIHNTLLQFHQFEMKGQKPDLKTLLHIYEKSFIPVGYDSPEQKKLRFEKGKQALKNYYQIYQKQFLGQRVALEKGFNLTFNGVRFSGKIDRIDRDGENLELVDYKTGSVKDQKKVDKDNQLTTYAMASQILFNKIPEKLCLYFIDDSKKIETTRSQKDIDKVRLLIEKTIESIKKAEFKPKPSKFSCGFCPYKNVCSFAITR
jgi:ATP-dependent DNA helicase UvrD/PcrA